MKSQLERYYNENVDPDQRRPFNELTPEEIKIIEGMWGFAFFKASEALREAKEAIKKALPLN
jgi:hypothetical protein